jgi:hypothetical protein
MPLPQGWDGRSLGTLLVALYAALLSTYQAFMKWRESRPQIRVFLKLSDPLLRSRLFEHPTPTLTIRIENHGFRDVTFDALCGRLEVKGVRTPIVVGKTRLPMTFPYTLKPNNGFDLVSDVTSFQQITKRGGFFRWRDRGKVRGVVFDQLSRQFKSKWQRVEHVSQFVIGGGPR